MVNAMQKTWNILVLGVGGNAAQGILKALNLTDIPHRVIGACVSPLAYGLYTTERSYISPYYNDPIFLDWLIDLCKMESIDVILTGVEPVLMVLAQNRDTIKEKGGAICIVSSVAALSIAQDKLRTSEWFSENHFPFPRYALASDAVAVKKLVNQCGLSLIGKPRYGRGGAGIFLIKDEPTLQYVLNQKDYLLQEYIGAPDMELTVGTFCDQNGFIQGSIVMKRELLDGTTYRAIVGDFPEVRIAAERIVTQLKPLGPCNLQFRIRADGTPVCFEINMRFSGTTPLRARFGFNEVKAALAHFILRQPIHLPKITQGIALRYWNEIYIHTEAYQSLLSQGKLTHPNHYGVLVENYGGL